MHKCSNVSYRRHGHSSNAAKSCIIGASRPRSRCLGVCHLGVELDTSGARRKEHGLVGLDRVVVQ